MCSHPGTVAIIIPAYNASRFISDAVDSALCQTYSGVQVIVVDDGSTDDTPTLLRGFANRIIHVRQQNRGVSAARNAGIERARSRWLMFVDADDILEANAVEVLVDVAMTRNEPTVAYGDVRSLNTTTGASRLLAMPELEGPAGLATGYMFDHGGLPPGAFLVPSELARQVGGFDQRFTYAADIHFLMRCGFYAPFVRSPQTVLTYRQHDDNMSRSVRTAISDTVDAKLAFQRWRDERQLMPVYCKHEEADLFSRIALLQFYRRDWDAVDFALQIARERGHTSQTLRRLTRLRRIPHWLFRLKDAVDGTASTLVSASEVGTSTGIFRRGVQYWLRDRRCRKVHSAATLSAHVLEGIKKCWWYLTDVHWRRSYVAIQRKIKAFRAGQHRAMKQIVRQTGDRILGGPFQGLRYPPAHSRTCCAQLLLGTYEKELRRVIEQICDRAYTTIIDIGASEGYYLCGFASRNTRSRVVGFESNVRLDPIIRRVARANALSNVEIFGKCDSSMLRTILHDARRTVVMCDVDGFEAELIDPELIPTLKLTDLLVETHDLVRPNVTELLVSRFQKSHDVEVIETATRTRSDLPEGIALDKDLADMAMDEGRGGKQAWLWMTARR